MRRWRTCPLELLLSLILLARFEDDERMISRQDGHWLEVKYIDILDFGWPSLRIRFQCEKNANSFGLSTYRMCAKCAELSKTLLKRESNKPCGLRLAPERHPANPRTTCQQRAESNQGNAARAAQPALRLRAALLLPAVWRPHKSRTLPFFALFTCGHCLFILDGHSTFRHRYLNVSRFAFILHELFIMNRCP